MILGLYSCTSKQDSENESRVPLMKVDWSDTTTIGKVINDYYKDSVFKLNKGALEIRDPFMNSYLPYRYTQLQKVLRPHFKQTTPLVGYMPTLMRELTGDSVIVDFQITWQQISPEDSLGKFIVTDKFIQKVNEQLHYEWIKEGDYWIRKNVEVPQTIQ